MEVLKLLSSHSRKEIARELGIDLKTVDSFLYYPYSGIYNRLGVKNRVQAVMEGIRLGLIDLEKIELLEVERSPWE